MIFKNVSFTWDYLKCFLVPLHHDEFVKFITIRIYFHRFSIILIQFAGLAIVCTFALFGSLIHPREFNNGFVYI